MNKANIDKLYLFISASAVAVGMIMLLSLLGMIVWKGSQALSIQFLFTSSSDFGAAGGILYQLLGSILLITAAAIFVLPFAVGFALYKSEAIQNPRVKKFLMIMMHMLNAVPAIVFGIFGLIVFVYLLGMGISWVSGAIILAFMILPTVTLATYQSINSIPEIYRESASALGLKQWQIIRKVVLPQGMNGAFSGLFLGLARAIGEIAPIMFIATAFSGVTLPTSLFSPVATLPTHIYALTQQAVNPQALSNAWGAGLVLIILVFWLGLIALFMRFRFREVGLR